jgi:hypothetical protein
MADEVTITLRDVYDAVNALKEKIAIEFSPIPAQVADHEKRLRVLETPVRTSVWIIVGTIVAGVVGLGSILTVLVMLMRIIPDQP